MKIEITGRVDEVRAVKQIGQTTKQDLWITENPDDKYPKPHTIAFWGDKAQLLGSIMCGDTVTVTAYTGSSVSKGERWPSYTGASVTINAEQGARPMTPMEDAAKVKEPEVSFGQSLPF